jgi:AraC family transcriptional regulator, regulatory protein of adaptative response / DNA-3-methyladenine glycosylase II
MASDHLDFERCYRAADSRDARFDGRFITAVTSTGIYCRPSCPATTPKRRNVRFYPTAAAAQRAGFRACKRCRPDAAPGSPDWDVRADVVARAVRLIGDGVVDRDGVPALAARLGYTTRHLNRMITAELGAGPLALARAQRAQTARILIETTDLGLADIAFAAGFGSVRQFNDTVREVFAAAPSELRAGALARPNAHAAGTGTVELRLPYREPLHAEALLDFLRLRAIAGVEVVDIDGYARGLRLPHGTATVRLRPQPGHVQATLTLGDLRDLAPAVARCRRLLDLDADPEAVDAALAEDPALAESVRKEPGIRVPRTVDGFELAMRAVVGQQVSVASARTTLARLVAALGPAAPSPGADGLPPATRLTLPDHAFATGAAAAGRSGESLVTRAGRGPSDSLGGAVARRAPGGAGGPMALSDATATADPMLGAELRAFPDAGQVADAPDSALGMPASRRRTVRALAAAVASGELLLDGGADRAETEAALLRLPGIGPWTANLIVMRALSDPDVFLPTDLGVRRGAAALGLPDDPNQLDQHARRWRPWRSYAVLRLWRQHP